MMSELKPCPFCGCDDAGLARVKTIFDHVTGYLVLCPDCGCTVGFNTDTEFTAFTDFSTEQEAIDAWNTRAERTCRPIEMICETLPGTDCPAWKCSECGELFEEGARYCSQCGAKVVEE